MYEVNIGEDLEGKMTDTLEQIVSSFRTCDIEL